MSGLNGDLKPFLEATSDDHLKPHEIVSRYLQHFSGRSFERYAEDRADPNKITGDDLVAVTMLSIQITLKTTSGITPWHAEAVENHHERIGSLLEMIPADQQLQLVTRDAFDTLLGGEGYASALYRLLRHEIGLKPVATSKLLARKRPQLFPVRDGVLTRALHRPDQWWRPWWEELQERPDLVERLEQIRADAGRPAAHLSVLRIADILVWMRQKGADAGPRLRSEVGPPLPERG